MKELSIEEKAKSYDDVRKKIAIRFGSNVADEIFSQFEMSEDEKIRKSLLDYLHTLPNHFSHNGSIVIDWIAWLEKQGSEPNWCHHKVDLSNCSEEYRKAYYDGWNNCNMQHSQCKSDGIDVVKCLINGMKFYYEDNEEATWGTEKFSMKVKDILAWLENIPYTIDREKREGFHLGYKAGIEKQGEQKPINKVEPKFKNGQWIVWRDKCYKVNYNGCGYELVDQDGLSTSLEYGTIDENAHLWDITTDAKDGDVLSYRNGQWIFILKRRIDKDSFEYYTLWSTIHNDLTINDSAFSLLINSIYPATKEQRDLLFQKMRGAGYEWDADKKELKKIEHIAWSEEDERIYQSIMDDTVQENQLNNEQTNWLRDIKYRYFQQPKQEWSEKDARILDNCISLIEDIPCTEDEQNWLKSLRPKNTWKPSNEQMKALHELNLTGNISYAGQGQVLIELYNDLKRLLKTTEGE